ncbi:DNRLRE domain-containing protein [Streptomyces sp. NPDC056405]|uniref:golvesin C-terminal-like domain-containing protein n=1 Tax=Streptomyces sp. NPDC056405 TaxID=3345811 RepID=UPI0035D9F2E2
MAYASSAPSSDGDGKGVIDSLADWLGGDDGAEPALPAAPQSDADVPDRQKLPKGKNAPKAKRIKELTGRRTANARYWQMSDGRTEVELSAVPTSYRDGTGRKAQWKPIDTSVQASETKGFDFANTRNTLHSRFGSDSHKLLRVEAGEGRSVTMGLAGADALKPTAKGSTVTYKDAIDGADLAYEVGAGRVKENIVLNERPSGPVKFTFTLDVDGLTPKQGKDGSVRFFGESADPVLVIPAGFMTDSKKDASSPYGTQYSTAVKQRLAKAGDGWTLTVTPDAKWLAAKERQYPVTVDPTIEIAPTPTTAQDVMISSDGPASNYDDNWRLSVGNTTTGSSRALLRFPLSGIPAGTRVDSADLKLYYDQTHTTSGDEVRLEAHRATQEWNEATATWNSAEGITGELSGTSVVVDDGDTGRTAAVGSWPASGNTTYTQYAVNRDYLYNKDSVAGDTYTWQPSLPEDGTYQVDVHSVPAVDRATNAPYTVTYSGGLKQYTVDQSAGTGGVWKTLGSHPFKAGTAGKIVLGDAPASTSTAVVADAVRFTKGGTVTKKPGEVSTWHSFPVTKTVQQWIDGTYDNHGFVVKAGDESADAPKGGPRYEGSEFGYGGESANYPRLVLTFGRQGVALDSPSVIHATGAELHWPDYQDPDTGSTGDDLVEYQVHRSVYQSFTPSAATLVAPLDGAANAFTDTTAVPTPADSADPFGRAYYYMVAVKTKDGQVIGSPTQLVRLPKAGRTTRVITAGQDTTLSSAQPTASHDTFDEYGPQPWLTVGNNSTTYGDTRTLLDFGDLGVPASSRILQATVRLWGTQSTRSAEGAVYELRPLTRDFDESATWNKATSATAWTTPGGDVGPAVSDVGAMSNDPARHDWDVTSLAQGWVTDPATGHGVAIRTADETAAQERSVFLSSEAPEQRLRPKLVVTYVDETPESTYYAPATPARMTPNSTYTVDVTLTNTTDQPWTVAGHELTYRWSLPDGTDATTGGNQVRTALPHDLAPGASVTVPAQVKTPINSDSGNKRTEYTLTWEVQDAADTAAAVAGLTQHVAVEDPTSNQLGLEKFYSYTGKNTGGGGTLMNNLAAGNSIWQYNAFSNPGRGLTTFARFVYNSQDTSDTVLGHGWSAQISGITRLGAPLDFHPNPHPTEVRLPDGDGTTHVFRLQDDGTWKAPAGVNYRLTAKPGLDCTPAKDPVPDAWTMLRPDGTRFLFGCDGYMTTTVDRNGNTQTFTYEERKSNNKPTKFLTYITDPASRQSLTIAYYKKGETSYQYIDDVQNVATGSKLNNSKIYDHVKSVTDISGRKISFLYTEDGLLGRLTDGDGSAQPKMFKFRYDAEQGNKNVKLVGTTDPRGHSTSLNYYYPSEGDDPKDHWRTQTITDRLGGLTSFDYVPNADNDKFTDTTVTDAEGHENLYVQDDFGRPVRTVNAKAQTTKLTWDADNNVIVHEEANGAKTAYCYDPGTGYPLWQRDAESNKASLPAQDECAPGKKPANAAVYEYQTRADGYTADIFRKTSPEGRVNQFGYDEFGNLLTVTDPKGVATATEGDYTTTYEYDAYGQMIRTIDANGNPTENSDFGPTGYPATITDALNESSSYVYDVRGQVTAVTDALGKKTTQTYDTFGRPLVSTVPKDQSSGDLITTPAPVYDANDNVTKSTAPNGAVSTAVYDAADQTASVTAPKDTDTSGERRTTYAYDRVGNLLTTTEPKGNLTPSIATDHVTTNHYDEIYQVTSVNNAEGDTIRYEYDSVGNVVTVVDPRKDETSATDDYTTKSTYDLNHRVVATKDAAGHTSRQTYDKDSLIVSATDPAGSTTLLTYDERGLKTEAKVPHDGSGDSITYRTTKYEYDEVGNTTKVVTPRGAETTSDSADFTARTEYDELNRPVRQYQPYDPDDTRYHDPDVYTQTEYDAVGRVVRTSLPPSEGQSVRNATTVDYFDNGWVKSSKDPWGIATTYDYDDMGQQTARTLTSAGGDSNRTMTWSYYPDGKLRAKADDGAPVGKNVVLADNSDTQSTSATGTWTKADTEGQQGYDHHRHAAGIGTDAFTWVLTVPVDGTYTAYVKYPKVDGAATNAEYTLKHGTETESSVTKNQNVATGTWVGLGTYTLKQGEATSLKLAQNGDGAVVADGVKLVRDNSADTDDEQRSFTYRYDVNGNLTDIDDTSSGRRSDAYTVTYTGLNQVQRVVESLAGEEQKATSYTYDANGQPLTVSHPDQYSAYAYDTQNLLEKVTVGDSADDTDPKVTSFTYTDLSQKLKETKANGNTVDHTYYLDGRLRTTAEKKPNGTLVSTHTYAYDANGNKAKDAAKKMNADDHSAYLESTTTYAYDPVDRLAKSVKTGNGAGTDTYVHDDNANVVSQMVKGTATTYDYDRNRLLSATAGGVTANYVYDPFGRQESVTSGGQVVERSTYDGFDHVVKSEKMDDSGALKATTYTFDPLDRTASKTADGETTDFDYLGLSEEVLGEQVAGELTKSYQYSPWGQRLSQVTHKDDGSEEDGYYGYNSHTDVETLTDENGDTKATYGYTAYGTDDETEFTGIDKPEASDPTKEEYNPYRFNSKRWDARSGTYDMGFRDYSPGLNRFTTRDMYNGALADMGLGSDPYTGNRYAFTSGNPTSSVEIDGHFDFGGGLGAIGSLFKKAATSVGTKSRGGLLSVAKIFGDAIGWNTPTASDGISYEPGDTPNYDRGLLVTPEATKEWQPQVAMYPFTKDDCSKGQSMVYYMPLDDLGRAQGVDACLSPGGYNYTTGTKKNPKAKFPGVESEIWGTGTEMPPPFGTDRMPPGYYSGEEAAKQGKPVVQRGHMLAKSLGGSGTDRRNLVTLYSKVNSPFMSTFESEIARRVESGETIWYSVRAHHTGDNTMPDSLSIYWQSMTTGQSGAMPIPNDPNDPRL